MANDLPTIENQQDLVEMLTRRISIVSDRL